jgi:nitrate reductase (NAD(P)H)
MMPSYHIGTLSEASKKILAEGGLPTAPGTTTNTTVTPSEPRPVFLQPNKWTKALLSHKTPISPDTKIFNFTLEHPDQAVGLPTGQHLLMRLRDPVSREAIIRAYTPLSDAWSEKGRLDVLVKIYPANEKLNLPGGQMTTALDSIPPGHWVEFKGPVGRYEYLGRGRFSVPSSSLSSSSSSGGHHNNNNNNRATTTRHVRRLVMVCAGSGITPILAVLRAVARDPPAQRPRCVVLDGNRTEADILCRAEMDALAAVGGDEEEEGGARWCRIVHTLSDPGDGSGWAGERGFMGAKLFEREAGPPRGEEDMLLYCGPPPLEKIVRECFTRMGWREEDMIFF